MIERFLDRMTLRALYYLQFVTWGSWRQGIILANLRLAMEIRAKYEGQWNA